jgi:uncharacterized Tic20 family protein
MNDNINTGKVHIYRLKSWAHVLNVFSLVFFLFVFGIPMAALVLIMASIFQAENEFIYISAFLGCLMIPLVILLGFNIVQIALSVVMSFFHYIKISPDGIEQRNSPYRHIRCNWSDVDKLGKFYLFYDAIYLNSYEVLGLSLSLKSPFRFLRSKQGLILLTGYEGWSDGHLANDLKQYAPTLFENQPVSPETLSENKEGGLMEAPSASQESRLLAALSHASVMFTSVGFFVPIVIYLTQKKKSSYLAFQAFQAFTWQIVMFLVYMLTASCMMGSVFLPVLLSTSSENARLLELSAGGMVIVMLASVFLMLFGKLIFVVYGIIGAFMTYQGKDFRYVIVGNIIRKKL